METKRPGSSAAAVQGSEALERAMGRALLDEATTPEDIADLMGSSAVLRQAMENPALFPGACDAVTRRGTWCPRIVTEDVRPWNAERYCHNYCLHNLERWEAPLLQRAPLQSWSAERKYIMLTEILNGLYAAVNRGDVDVVYRYWRALGTAEQRRPSPHGTANGALEAGITAMSPVEQEHWTIPRLARVLAHTMGVLEAWNSTIPMLLVHSAPGAPLNDPQRWATALPLSDEELDAVIDYLVTERHQGLWEEQPEHEIAFLARLAAAFPDRRVTGNARDSLLDWIDELAEPDSELLGVIGTDAANTLLAAAHSFLGDAEFEQTTADWPLSLRCHFAATRANLPCAPPLAPPAPFPKSARI